jgi:hypothetical protein
MVGKVTLGKVFSEYFGFPCQFSFHRLLHNHYLSSGAGTTGQFVTDVPSGLSLTPSQETKELVPRFINDELPLVQVSRNYVIPTEDFWIIDSEERKTVVVIGCKSIFTHFCLSQASKIFWNLRRTESLLMGKRE